MNKIDWGIRFKNRTFWVALASAVVLLIQQLGLGRYLPSNIMDIVNTILTIFVIVGVVIDPTTSGITDGDK